MTEQIAPRFVEEHEIALALARNSLGMQLPVTELVAEMGVDIRHVTQLSKSNTFVDMVKAYKRELSEDGEGIRLKSAVALEHSIKKLYTMIHNPDTPANVVVQGVKQLADMAGIGGKQDVAVVAAGSGFVVNIDLSGLKELADAVKQQKPQNIVESTAITKD